MKNLIYIFLFTTINLAAQGLKFSSDEQLNQIDAYSFDEKGYTENLPYSYSLEKYVPPITKQQGGTCVGFSALYYGLSTMYNIKSNITSYTDKLAYSFDPYYIYSLINNGKNDCDDGLYMYEAMDAISKVGCKKMFYPRFLSCNSNWNKEEFLKTVPYSEPYKIANFYKVSPERLNFITEIKEILNYNIPVIVGAQITKSLSPSTYNNDGTGVTSNGLWSPKSYEKIVGGHAMCVVGYDDYKYGGSFRLANSWGKEFGDNGFMWIKYSDFKKYVKEAYFMEAQNLKNLKNYSKFTFTNPKYSGHSYEGEVSDGYMHGYGIYSFGNKSYLIGKFNYGSREDWFMIINENDDQYIKMIKYSNNKPIDSKTLGFSTVEKDKSLNELKEYIKIIMPNKKIIILNEEPDIVMAKKLD